MDALLRVHQSKGLRTRVLQGFHPSLSLAMGVAAVCMGISCAGLSGLRSTVPLFMLSYFHKSHPDLVSLGSDYEWLGETWATALLGVLMALEVIADKIPHLDHVLHVLMTVVHAAAGAVAIVAPSTSSSDTTSTALHIAMLVAGGFLALVLHGGRAAVRFLSTATTGGAANPCVSITEDVLVFVLCPLALLFAAMSVVVAILVVVALPVSCYMHHRKKKKKAMQSQGAGQPSVASIAQDHMPPQPYHQMPPAPPPHMAMAPALRR